MRAVLLHFLLPIAILCAVVAQRAEAGPSWTTETTTTTTEIMETTTTETTETTTTEAAVARTEDETLLWSSTGGGWRAMFACIGYANVFRQAGLFSEDSSRFAAVSTTSGGSWFSTQLFYSQPFYDRTVMERNFDDLYDFVFRWMTTYWMISSNVTNETQQICDTSDIEQDQEENPDPDLDYGNDNDKASVYRDICYMLFRFNFDWAFFVEEMLWAASMDYGDANFVDTIANTTNRIPPLKDTDLLIQATLVPNSRIRNTTPSTVTTAVYLGHNDDDDANNNNNNNDNDDASSSSMIIRAKLFTTPLSAAFVIDTDGGARFRYGSEDKTRRLNTYVAHTPVNHSWTDWEDFFLYDTTTTGSGTPGTIEIDNNTTVGGRGPVVPSGGNFATPFGGSDFTTVAQVAAISSAAGGSASPLVPSVYTQNLSMGYYAISEWAVAVRWRILVGMAVGIAVMITARLLVWVGTATGCVQRANYKNSCSFFVGIVAFLITVLLYGLGSIVVATVFDVGVDRIYRDPRFDRFAVCSQWPHRTCGDRDGVFIDGWFVDNPALAINVGQYHQKLDEETFFRRYLWLNTTVKVILTNTNEVWNSTFTRAQLLQYFNTSFNDGIEPGEFLWAPSYWAPYRSPQIFGEYLDEQRLDASLEPIPNSNMTTAILRGTTIDNPSFGVRAGQSVEILLLNLNENITTFVIGKEVIDKSTPRLANMTRNVASNRELVRRVRAFVDG